MSRTGALALALSLSFGALGAGAQTLEITAQSDGITLAGTLQMAPAQIAAALILPGSGPTDRNGNNPQGLAASSYSLLARDLAAQGISTAHVDKRGIGTSGGDPDDVVLADYAADTSAWIDTVLARTGAPCVWLVGHSEGAIVATLSSEDDGVCGLVLVAAPGRTVGDLFRDQVASQPLISPFAEAFDTALDVFEAGGMPDLSALHPGLHPIFAPETARYTRDLIAADPAAALAETDLPVMLIHGDGDFQTPPEEAAPLRAARPDAAAHVLSGMTHVLKVAIPRDQAASVEAFMQASLATYANPNAPLHPRLVPLIAAFIRGDEAPPPRATK